MKCKCLKRGQKFKLSIYAELHKMKYEVRSNIELINLVQ